MGMEKQAGGESPGSGCHQWSKESVPERYVAIAAERLRENQRGSDGRSEQRTNGAG
jgi:hypothetical protein